MSCSGVLEMPPFHSNTCPETASSLVVSSYDDAVLQITQDVDQVVDICHVHFYTIITRGRVMISVR